MTLARFFTTRQTKRVGLVQAWLELTVSEPASDSLPDLRHHNQLIITIR